MKTIALFNNKGGVGKTTLVYHLAYMLAEQGKKCLAVDLDPQVNLTSMFLSEEQLEQLYFEGGVEGTIMQSIQPLNRGIGDIKPAPIFPLSDQIGLIPGNLALSLFEDKLSVSWSRCLDRDEAAFRQVSAFHRIIQEAGQRFEADVILIDMGPNFGAMNRAILIAAEYVVVPMAADLFSLQGLKNLGERLVQWREQWQDRLARNRSTDLSLPLGKMLPLGYVVLQHGIKGARPVKSYLNWANRIPATFQSAVLQQPMQTEVKVEADQNCLALLKHYHSLVPMAMEVRKPIFALRPADGAIGAHLGAVRKAYADFQDLARVILTRIADEQPAVT